MTAQEDKYWSLKNSWWVLTTYLVVFSWVGFLYIGMKVGKTKWIRWSLFYMLAMVLAGLSIVQYVEYDGMTMWVGVLNTMLVAMWLFSIVHALFARPEYLRLLKEQEESPEVAEIPQGAVPVASEGRVHVYYVPPNTDQIPDEIATAEVTANEHAHPVMPDAPGREVDI